mmetsp:Transcript_7100/g.25199  ORF Transcript_7100/g.25199 Transcript_7100/m.25199 type:complete len:86 (-) Transcript_7100:2109-2366(-)
MRSQTVRAQPRRGSTNTWATCADRMAVRFRSARRCTTSTSCVQGNPTRRWNDGWWWDETRPRGWTASNSSHGFLSNEKRMEETQG